VLAATSAAGDLHAIGYEAGSTPGDAAVWVTDENQCLARASSISWRPVSGTTDRDVIVLNPKVKCQQILGFGAAFTDAACYRLSQLPDGPRAELFHQLFHPSEMGLSVCRTCIGSSDYSANVYTYDGGEPDPDSNRFSIAQDRRYILPMLRQARAVNPELFLFFPLGVRQDG